MIRTTIPVIAVLFLALSPACSSRQTAEEAVREFGGPFCERFKTCSPEVFGRAFPGGPSACVQKMVDALPAGDRDKKSACDEEQIDNCTKDVSNVGCETFQSSANLTANMPSSCKGC